MRARRLAWEAWGVGWRRSRGGRALAAVGLVAMGVWLLGSSPALANDRAATLAALEDLETRWPGGDVKVEVLGGGGSSLRIGEPLVYRFASERSGYLTALHVDTHGTTTLLFPRGEVEAGRIGRDRSVELPGADDGFSLEVQPPVGRDVVYAIVTDEPIGREQLAVADGDPIVSLEAHQAPDLVRRLHAILMLPERSGEVRVAHVAQRIDGRGEIQYRSADIVDFFGARTRSIRPPKLDLQIQFATDSAALDSSARRNIDEFARALKDPKLAGMRFTVAGHTDDRGSDEHNLGLSRRRANEVMRYLVDEGGIDAERLEIEAHGEKNPLMNEDSDYARRINRRVEFAPAR